MKSFLYSCAVLLLLLNGVGAIYGGLQLMSSPDGSSLMMPVEYLQYSPFDSYFIPGLVLFIANGLGSFAVLLFVVFGYRKDALLIVAQGAVLCGWIVIQMAMMRMTYFLHFAMGTVGLALIVLGIALLRLRKKEQQ